MNEFEHCPNKKKIREEVMLSLVDHITKQNKNTLNRYVFLPGIFGYSELILSNKLSECKDRNTEFCFFEREESIRNSPSWVYGTFKNTMQSLNKMGYETSIYSHAERYSDTVNGGWLDLCSSRSRNVIEWLTWHFDSLMTDSLLFVTWKLDWQHIKEEDRVHISPIEFVNTLNSLASEDIKYSLVYEKKYLNLYSKNSNNMVTFGIKKNGKSEIVVDIPNKDVNILSVMQKQTTKNKTTKTTKKTVADYIKLASRGFTNKQIAVYWKKSLRSISAYAANANR